MNISKEKMIFLHICTIIILAVFCSSIFLNSTKYIAGGDGYFHLERFFALAANLKNGYFPARMSTTFWNGYGNATLIMYPQTFIYIPAIIYLLTNNYCLSMNIFLLFINITTGLIMYFCSKEIFNKSLTQINEANKKYNIDSISLIASLLWIYAPYRLTDLYIRMAIGELLGAMFLPLFFLGIYYLLIDDYKKSYIFVIASTLLFKSHLLFCLFAAIIFFFVFILNIKKMSFARLKNIFICIIFIFALNINSIVPMVEYILSYDMTMPFVTDLSSVSLPLNLFIKQEVVNYSIQLPFFILLICSIVFSLFIVLTIGNKNNLYIQCVFLAIFFTLLTSKIFNWKILYKLKIFNKFLDSLQFPYRLSMIASFFIAIISSVVIYLSIQKVFNHKFQFVGYILFVIFLTNIYLPYSQFNHSYGQLRFFGNTDYMHQKSDIWNLNRYNGSFIYDDKTISVKNIKKSLNSISFDYTSLDNDETTCITLPLFNFPGYVCRDENNNFIPINEDNNAQIMLSLTKKEGSIYIEFENKILWKICDALSFILLFLFLIYLFIQHKISSNHKSIYSNSIK